MFRLSAFRTCAAISILAAFAISGAALTAATPAAARVNISFGTNAGGINFGYFHNNLSRRGHWIDHPRWGDVWQPPNACHYRPYFNGYFEYTDYGLLWVGYDRWSNITDHYGRWVYDPHYCTLWIPGYVWAPAWVIFREGGGYFGWFPMPPDYGDFDDGPYFGDRSSWDNYYGYGDWYGMRGNSFYNLWIFVDTDHFYRHDYRNYVVDRSRARSIINMTSDTTHYSTDGDRIVNRSITSERLERITHQHIRPVEARALLKSDVPMAPVSAGRGLARQEGSGRAGPHLHDRDFKPMMGPEGKEKTPTNNMGPGGRGEGPTNPSGKESDRMGRGHSNGPEATPSPQSQPNAGEDHNKHGLPRGGEKGLQPSSQPESQPAPGGEDHNMRGRHPGGEGAIQPSPQPESQPAPGGEDHNMRGRHPGGVGTMQPSPQPESQPAPGGEKTMRERNRGGEQTMQPSPQPESQPAPGGEERNMHGRNRGGEQTMQPSPQPESQPAPGGEKRIRGHPAGTPEAQPQNAAPEQQGPPPEGKKKENKPANPDEEKKKHPDNETGPGR